jgi:alpha-galactosidase
VVLLIFDKKPGGKSMNNSGISPTQHAYSVQGKNETVFSQSKQDIFLSQLFGVHCGICGKDEGPERIRGMFSLAVDNENIEWRRFNLKESAFIESASNQKKVNLAWEIEGVSLSLESVWEFCTVTGVWSRKDRLLNIGDKHFAITRCLSRFSLTPGIYEVYSQDSRWCNENRGAWRMLDHGSMVFQSHGGRTSQGSTPFICLRGAGDDRAMAFHVVPQGNWVIKAQACNTNNDSLPAMVVDIGLSDDCLRYPLPPGGVIELPEVILYDLDGPEPHQGIHRLHQYLLDKLPNLNKKYAPVVYNTWFDDFDFLDLDRMRRQLKAAKAIGCEVFVIDAGWYGGGEGNWSAQVGDWREKKNGAFLGRMDNFAEEVRAAGLGFGLWLEPERIGLEAPILHEHPEWFIKSDENYYYPDLCNEAAFQYFHDLFAGIISKYQPVWIKFDFNFELVKDPSVRELHGYFEALYNFLDELRTAYPDVLIEGCSSGAMRQDINTFYHFDGNFLSDNVNPNDCLRIYQGAILRGLPGRMTRWAVLRSSGSQIPKYGTPIQQAPIAVLTPTAATWEFSITTDIDFAVRASMMGMLGFSGDLAGLSGQDLSRLQSHVQYYKKWRQFIAASKAFMLTSPRLQKDNQGWVVIQLQNKGRTTSLVFVFRLDEVSNRIQVRPQSLEPDRNYSVVEPDQENQPFRLNGRQLMDVGFPVVINQRNGACILEILPEDE